MRWFRFYDDAVNDPKVQRLSSTLFRFWVNTLCLASKHNGTLPPIRDMSFVLRLPEAKIASMMAELITAGLLDQEGAAYSPHNWRERQYESDLSTNRVKRFRQRFRNGERNVIEQSRTESETEQSRADRPPAAFDSEKEKPVSKEAKALAKKLAEMFGGDPESKQWNGCYVDVWLNEGHSEDRIMSVAGEVRARGTEVNSLKYFIPVLGENDDPVTNGHMTTSPPTGFRNANQTEYVAYMREKLKDPKFDVGHIKYSRWQWVPENWPNVTPLRRVG